MMLPARSWRLPMTRLGFLASMRARKPSEGRREKRGSREAGAQLGVKPHGERSPGRDGLEERGLVGADMLKCSTGGVADVHQWEVGRHRV